jgi:glycosidase
MDVAKGSAWEWSTVRNEFYLHQFAKNQPDLNYRHPAVITAFKVIRQKYMYVQFNISKHCRLLLF